MLKASGTVASPWGSQGKSCKSEITHMFTNLAPLGRTSRSRGGVENVSMSLESSVGLSPPVHPPGSGGLDQRGALRKGG